MSSCVSIYILEAYASPPTPLSFQSSIFKVFQRDLMHQGRFRDFLQAFERALEGFGTILEPSWSSLGATLEPF